MKDYRNEDLLSDHQPLVELKKVIYKDTSMDFFQGALFTDLTQYP